jgi:hypothetical protein
MAYINAIPWAPGQLDSQEYSAFAKAAFYGIDQETAFALVLAKMQSCGATKLRPSKIWHSLARAYALGGDGISHSAPPDLNLPPIEPYNELLLKDTVGDLAGKVGETFFVERSKFTTWNRTAAGFLHKITLPGEHAFLTADKHSPDGFLFTNRGIDGCSVKRLSVSGRLLPQKFEPNFDCLSFLERGQQNAWFLNNPIDDQPHYDGRFAYGFSYHCVEVVSSWRYLILETDIVASALWLALLAMAPIRIVAIYFSGGRGYHALVRIDAATKLEADDLVEIYRRDYVPLGACSGALSAFRLTRLPKASPKPLYKFVAAGLVVKEGRALFFLIRSMAALCG